MGRGGPDGRAEDAFAIAAVEHRLDVLPGVDQLLAGRLLAQVEVTAPGVEVGGIGVAVFAAIFELVAVKDELVGREIGLAEGAANALRAGAVVAARQEAAAAAPAAAVIDLKKN